MSLVLKTNLSINGQPAASTPAVGTPPDPRMYGVVTFDTPGTHSFEIPVAAGSMRIEVWGAGAAGGAGNAAAGGAGSQTGGGGGGGGGYLAASIGGAVFAQGGTVEVLIGAPGAPVAGAAGGNATMTRVRRTTGTAWTLQGSFATGGQSASNGGGGGNGASPTYTASGPDFTDIVGIPGGAGGMSPFGLWGGGFGGLSVAGIPGVGAPFDGEVRVPEGYGVGGGGGGGKGGALAGAGAPAKVVITYPAPG